MKYFRIFAAAGLLAVTLPTASHASIVIDIEETGGNVVASYSGSLVYDDLHFEGPDISLDYLRLSATSVRMGNLINTLGWSGFSGPASWGAFTYAASVKSTTGTFIAFDLGGPEGPLISLPKDYIQGRAISGTATFGDQTFASLGLTAGQYVYASPEGQTITVNIGDVGTVPEPASWALMIVGFGFAGAAMRGLRRRSPAFPRTGGGIRSLPFSAHGEA